MRSRLRHLWTSTLATLSLKIVAVSAAASVALLLADALHVWRRGDSLPLLGLSWAGLLERGYAFQVLTSPLIHADVVHMFFNLLVIAMFGPMVEHTLGRLRFGLLVTVAAAGASAAFLAMHSGTGVVVLGASGIVYGLLVAGAFVQPNMTIHLFWFFPVRLKYAALLMAGMAFLLTVSPDDGNVSHVSHLGGAVAGLVFMLIQRRFARRRMAASSPASADGWAAWAATHGKASPRIRRGGKRPDVPDEL
jgi:membrane associated rhomboid family serine protease